jgi:hypothetical protein
MRRRTQDDSVWAHVVAYDSEVFWIPAIIIAVFGWFVTTVIYCSVVSDQIDLREDQFKVVHALEDSRQIVNENGVQEMAKSLIRIHDVKFGAQALDDKDFRKEVAASSKTGDIPQVLVPKATWDEFLPGEGDYLTAWLSLGLLATLALMSCAGSLCYANECSERREFIADLNLRKPSHVLFLLCTPILWPFYPISLIGMHLDARRQRQRNREVPAVATTSTTNVIVTDGVGRLLVTLDGIESMSAEVFVDDRVGALEAYHRICSELAVGNVKRRMQKLGEQIEDLDQEATDLSTTMRATAQKRTKAKADLRALEKLSPTDGVPDRETAETQFNRLVALAGVNEVWPIENGIGLLVKARLEHEGKHYDLGDWKLLVTDKSVDASEVRSGIRAGWSMYEYPAYRYGQGSFCFGQRHLEMNDRCRSGHLLEAAIIAVECLNSVNANDLKKVPKAFNQAPEQESDS